MATKTTKSSAPTLEHVYVPEGADWPFPENLSWATDGRRIVHISERDDTTGLDVYYVAQAGRRVVTD